ncbi:alkaline phosphatase family protein [Falsibacillus pallidus]|uniref:alkaline phosphatase family protein n=1 Tax=Falsibacillus pallidus TaxID=493781 RepID=UPI003D990B63
MKNKPNYLIVISFDCLSGLDFPILEQLQNFKAFLHKASYSKNVESIYPSVTYPCHATIVTGKYPKNHGIINNTFIQPGWDSPDWYWERKYIKGTTLYDEAKKAGLKTAALLWPVTAKADIDYNMPEIFANRRWHNQILVSLMNGTPMYQLEMNKKFGHIRKGLNQPALDDFVLESTVQTIKDKKPNLLLVHFTDLDTQRHYHGFSSKEAMDAIKRHDERLGRIISALKEAGIYDESAIIALGDHSALDESKAIKLNVLLQKRGLLQADEKGNVKDWRVYCKSCDGSAYIYVKDERDDEAKAALKELLDELMKKKENGIESVLTGEEAGVAGADDTCVFMIEALKGYYFSEAVIGHYLEEIREQDVKEKKYTYACHGYSPLKPDYHTIFMASGKGIKQNRVVGDMRLIDEGPTFARLLGLELGEVDGRPIEELLDLG